MTKTIELRVPAPDIEPMRHDRGSPAARGRQSRPPLFLGLLQSKGFTTSNATARRRAEPIRCALGPNGSGKTALLVHDLLPSLDEGRTVYSTVPIDHPGYRPFTAWHQFLEATDSDFLADEIVGLASSRDYGSLHGHVIQRMNQLRKVGNTFSWSSPSWKRADTVIREVTRTVTECRGMRPAAAFDEHGKPVMWAPNRLFRFRTYDVKEFDEWNAGKRERITPAINEWWYGPGSRAFGIYDTLASVGHVDPYDPDVCRICDRPKARQTCRGHGA